MKPQLADMFELPVVVYVPPDATVIGPVDDAPSGKVMIMFTVDGSPQAETVQFWSSTTWPGAIEQPAPPPPPPPPPGLPASAAGTSARETTSVATASTLPTGVGFFSFIANLLIRARPPCGTRSGCQRPLRHGLRGTIHSGEGIASRGTTRFTRFLRFGLFTGRVGGQSRAPAGARRSSPAPRMPRACSPRS